MMGRELRVYAREKLFTPDRAMSGLPLARVRELPWISFGLFVLTYGVFGWLVGEMVPHWQVWLLAHRPWFPWDMNGAIATQISWLFGGGLVLVLMVVLTAPMQLMQLLFGSWLRSDVKALISVLAWAIAAVLIICWIEQFIRFFVLLAAGMLCNLDLQLRGCRKWQVFVILTGTSLGSFALGGYLFSQWQIEIASLWSRLSLV